METKTFAICSKTSEYCLSPLKCPWAIPWETKAALPIDSQCPFVLRPVQFKLAFDVGYIGDKIELINRTKAIKVTKGYF